MRGGYRPGAGRKSPQEKKQRAAFEEVKRVSLAAIAATGLTPLEVMIESMRFLRSQAAQEQASPNPNRKVVRDYLSSAASIARDAAPYLHTKLAAVPASVHSNEDDYRPGKKELAQKAAKTATIGTEWDEDLRLTRPRVN